MQQITEIIAPVFALIACGYLVVRIGYLGAAVGDALADFVFKVGVPLLLWRSIATADFADTVGLPLVFSFWVAYFSGVIATWLLAWIWIGVIFGRDARATIVACVAAGFSNLVLLGIPLIERAYGQDGLQILFLLVSIHLPIVMFVSTIFLELAERLDGIRHAPVDFVKISRSVAKSLFYNPIIMGILAGVFWRLTGLGFGGIPGQLVNLIAQATVPLALFSLGMGLIKYGIKGNLLPASGLAAICLIILPGVVFVLATQVFVLPDLWTKVAVLAAASPTGVNAYLFATHVKTGEGLATNTIVVSMLGSVMTIPLWLALTGI